MPEDPFFWFCSPNFALYTYPANYIPKSFLGDGSSLVYHYSDVVSRTGTPELLPGGQTLQRDSEGNPVSNDMEEGAVDADRQNQWGVESDDTKGSAFKTKVIPPSICLCQPTEIGENKRTRWEIELGFVDDRGLILADGGFFPGALGQRFIYEVKSDNVDQFLRASEVPQGQLLYFEHVKLSKADLEKKRLDAQKKKELWADESSGSEGPALSVKSDGSRDGGVAGNSKQRSKQTKRRRNKDARQQVASARERNKEEFMLPPLLSCR